MLESGRDPVALAVVEPSQAGEARRLASALARAVGFDPVGQGKIALVVTELANNLIRHAAQGELIIQATRSGPRRGIEILAIDRGPGVPDFRRCLVDGYSTAGTPGNGLGAVVRLADAFDVHSVPASGTVISARVWVPAPGVSNRSEAHSSLEVGGVCLPMAGEVECGDAWAFEEFAPGQASLIVADGLGHGPKAAEASSAAVASFRSHPSIGPGEHLEAIHQAIKGTRGAAVAVASIDLDRREVRFAGVGNIAATVLGDDGQRRGLVSHNGTVGGNMRKTQEFTVPWSDDALLVMHSDGLASQWRLDDASALRRKATGVIAGVLYRDHSRRRDDVTVVVARGGPTPR